MLGFQKRACGDGDGLLLGNRQRGRIDASNCQVTPVVTEIPRGCIRGIEDPEVSCGGYRDNIPNINILDGLHAAPIYDLLDFPTPMA